MADRPSFLDYGSWSTRTWVTALIAGLVALVLFLLFGAGFFWSLVIGILVFLGVVWWLQRDAVPATAPMTTPTAGPTTTPAATPQARTTPEAATAPTPPATPAAAVTPATPTAPGSEPLASAPPAGTAGIADGPEITEPPVARSKPQSLTVPREGGPDDLKRIRGIGPRIEEMLNSLGYYHFEQVAAWTSEEVAWVDSNLEGFNGRATRDDWVGQARILASGGTTDFSERADKGEND